jgi:hypothetical protein
MFSKISKDVSVPIALPITEREPVYTMGPGMQEDRVGAVNNSPSSIPKATTEVDIFKPNREEALIEAINHHPRLALHRKASTSGLLNLLRSLVIKVQAAVSHIPGIARPNAVHEQDFR